MMSVKEEKPTREVQLMYSLLRCAYGPEHVPEPVARTIKPQKIAILSRAFSDLVNGDRLSTALAFALADIAGPGSRELARSLGKDEEEGERLAAIGREAVCRFFLALLRGREKLRDEFRKDIDRWFLSSVQMLLNIYIRARQPLSLAALVMSGNSRIYYEGMDEAAREFARELAELLKVQVDESPEIQESAPQTEPEQEMKTSEGVERLRRRLRRLRIAVTKARSVLESST